MTYLMRIDPARNMARFYHLDLQPDLFCRWVLGTEWGRIGRAGTVRSTLCADEGTAMIALARQMAGKGRRGYAVVPRPVVPAA